MFSIEERKKRKEKSKGEERRGERGKAKKEKGKERRGEREGKGKR